MRRGGPLVVSLRARPLESMGADQVCVVEEYGSLFTTAGLEIGGYGSLRWTRGPGCGDDVEGWSRGGLARRQEGGVAGGRWLL